MDRRQFLTAGLGTALTGAIAGCTGSSETENEDATRTTARTETATEATTRNPTTTTTTRTTSTTTRTPDPPSHLFGLQGATGVSDVSGQYKRTFQQSAHGVRTEFTTRIPKNLFQYFDGRSRNTSYGAYVSDLYDDKYIQNIANAFKDYRKEEEWSSRQMVDLAIAFVQGLKYTSDVNEPYNEYPKYPVETLKDRGGDCEDTAILLASILRKLGFGVVLLEIPSKKHMALGLKGEESIPGTYVKVDGTRYYYVETTGEGWRVGQAPDGYTNVRTEIRSVDDHPSLTFAWVTKPGGPGKVQVDFAIFNAGMAPSRNARIKARVRSTDSKDPIGGAETDPAVVPPRESVERSVTLDPPANRTLRLRFGVTIQGEIHDIAETDWQNPA
ncbi:hypothetical protein BRD00_01570 [Halobacteriales archaeon QS_8_69_26]|nr:MAG: hypothetical protein BRD00_01570 [Halobacteriales archaeon QS_8_69_26]